jgi:hypothetical protein
MSLQDRIFFDYKEAIETYLRMGFEFAEGKRLVMNCMEVRIKKIGEDIWRASVITNGYQHKADS